MVIIFEDNFNGEWYKRKFRKIEGQYFNIKDDAALSKLFPLSGKVKEKSGHLRSHDQDATSTALMQTTPPLQDYKDARKNHHKKVVKVDLAVTHPKTVDARLLDFSLRSQTADDIAWVMMRDSKYEKEIHERCQARTYDVASLPNASIVISFHESEKLEHLLHTINSIVYTTPYELLHEIILIADNTSKEEHGEPLETYLRQHFPTLMVKIHHSTEQLGLIKARLRGINMATGEVAVVMDSHMELQPKWLEALVYEIRKNPKTMTTSFLDWMKPDEKTGKWRYEHGSSRYKTVWFWWNLLFTFMEIPQAKDKQTEDPTQPIISPGSVGTIWAINREFFYECGAMDDGMVFWGGENIDLPLRVFLWGGQHVNVPCSHAAHLEERGQRNYRTGHMKNTSINYLRVVETWFDEYKEVFYMYNPLLEGRGPGDISKRLELKKQAPLQFHDFMTRFYPELSAPQFESFAWGTISNGGRVVISKSNVCLCAFPNKNDVSMQTCSKNVPHNKCLMWNTRGEFRLAAHIIEPYVLYGLRSGSLGKARIDNYVSVFNTGKITRWTHWKDGPIAFYSKPLKKFLCVEAPTERNSKYVLLAICDVTNPYQQWTFEHYNTEYEQLTQGLFSQTTQTDLDILYHTRHLNLAVSQKNLTL